MSSFEEIAKNAQTEIMNADSMLYDQAILQQINNIIQELNGNGMSGKNFDEYFPIELSKIAGTLAILKDNLSDIIARYYRNMQIEEERVKAMKANLWIGAIEKLKQEGKKATKSNIENRINIYTQKYRLNKIFYEEFYTKALYKWRSANHLLDVISQRINVLQSNISDITTSSSL